jgi:hypothetical protein
LIATGVVPVGVEVVVVVVVGRVVVVVDRVVVVAVVVVGCDDEVVVPVGVLPHGVPLSVRLVATPLLLVHEARKPVDAVAPGAMVPL